MDKIKIGIIGLGYVGLPLAIEFGKKIETIGFDIKLQRILELNMGIDVTNEINPSDFENSNYLRFSNEIYDLKNCNVYIITVPTPITASKIPDFTYLIDASQMIGEILAQGDTVIYESTVYPGAIEEVCVPRLASASGLEYNQDFFVGYSPERINPGDKQHTLPSITKLVSGSTEATAELVHRLYSMIITAGTFKVSSIQVAEAAKVIENIQRDVNIALINEFAQIFGRLGIDTTEVLEAAETKWNFLPFKPGLVGGHCIGVDPYYLAHKANEMNQYPEMILAGRRTNEFMVKYIENSLIEEMVRRKIDLSNASILILGVTFKENCPDIRNSKTIDLVTNLRNYGFSVDVYDPWANNVELSDNHQIQLLQDLPVKKYECVVIPVGHNEFIELGAEKVIEFCKKKHLVYDLKSIFARKYDFLRL